jgi:hypothetical protein
LDNFSADHHDRNSKDGKSFGFSNCGSRISEFG